MTLSQVALEGGPEIAAALPRDRARELLAGVSADRVADLFRKLEEPARSRHR